MIDIRLEINPIDIDIGLTSNDLEFTVGFTTLHLDIFIDGTFPKLNISIEKTDELNVGFELGTIIPQGDLPYYDGTYEVTPKTIEQNLETKNKIMRNDVTIFEIPYSSVSNPQGGETINIAWEG